MCGMDSQMNERTMTAQRLCCSAQYSSFSALSVDLYQVDNTAFTPHKVINRNRIHPHRHAGSDSLNQAICIRSGITSIKQLGNTTAVAYSHPLHVNDAPAPV